MSDKGKGGKRRRKPRKKKQENFGVRRGYHAGLGRVRALPTLGGVSEAGVYSGIDVVTGGDLACSCCFFLFFFDSLHEVYYGLSP